MIIELIERQDARIAQLEARIAELEGRLNQNSRNSSRPPSTDIYRRPQTQRNKGEKSAGGQKGHKGKTLEMVDNPDDTVVHRVHSCQMCGKSLVEIEPFKIERRQIHDSPPLKIIVTEHQAEHKRCPHCGQCNRAEFPPEVQNPVQYGPNLKSLMTYFTVYQFIPYDRSSEVFSDLFGRSLSKATLVKSVSDCSQNLVKVEEQTRDLLAEARVLHVDETGMRVKGIRQWLHVASTEILTLYGHHRKRGSQATDAMEILPRFKGTAIHDFWASYFKYPCQHALCNAHLLRELKGITENYGQLWSSHMHDLLQEIKEAVDEAKIQSRLLNPHQISDFLERYQRIIEEGILENPVPEHTDQIVKRGRKKQSKAKNLLDRCQKYPNEILSFMVDFSIPFTNNQAERDIRMVKLQQKISGTFRSEEGASGFCRVRGYISTVKKNDQPVLASLVKAFEGNPFFPSSAH